MLRIYDPSTSMNLRRSLALALRGLSVPFSANIWQLQPTNPLGSSYSLTTHEAVDLRPAFPAPS